MFAKRILTLAVGTLLSLPATAHSIFLNCEALAETVECKGSFSDGSSADNIPFEVISYEDEMLSAGRTDPDATFNFNTPDQDYYILLDAGPGHVLELDMTDVQ